MSFSNPELRNLNYGMFFGELFSLSFTARWHDFAIYMNVTSRKWVAP